MGGPSAHDAAFADMIQGLKNEAVNRGATSLMDEDVGTLGVPDPRILIVGCGGSGNNTLNRITHLGVEGAVTVAINTDKQHLDNTRALQKLLVGRHITRGLGAGGDPSTGRRCAEAGREMIKRIVPVPTSSSSPRASEEVLELAFAPSSLRKQGGWRSGRRHRHHPVPRRAPPTHGSCPGRLGIAAPLR